MTNAQSRNIFQMPQEFIRYMFEREYNNVSIVDDKIVIIHNGIEIVIVVQKNCTTLHPIELFNMDPMSRTTIFVLFNIGAYWKDHVRTKGCFTMRDGNTIITKEEDFRSRTIDLHELVCVLLDADNRRRFEQLLYIQKLFYTEN